MAGLARLPKSKSALVPYKDNRKDTQKDTRKDTQKDTCKDQIQTECEKIIDRFRELTHEKHRVWPRFKQLESSFVNQPTSTLDPTTLRSYIPHEIISILLAASPAEEFTVTNHRYVGKVRKASAIWKVDPKHLLFQTAFDYGNQGEGFFSALFALAKADDDWSRCRTALQACVLDRRQLQVLPQISRRDTSLSCRKGIIESDVRNVISGVPPRTPPSPARPPPQLSHDQSQAVPEPPSTPTKTTEQVSRKPGDELEKASESTPERGREADCRQSPIFTPPPKLAVLGRSPIQSSASSPVPPCKTLAAVETGESPSQDKQPNTADDSNVDEFDGGNFVNDSSVPNDFFVDGHCLIGASDTDNDDSIGNDFQTHAMEFSDSEIDGFKTNTHKEALRINAGGTIPETSPTYHQQSTAPHLHSKTTTDPQKMSPAPKRLRLNDASAGPASDAQKIIEEGSWITDQQLMNVIGPMCDTSQGGADGVMVVESLETQKMVEASYVVCRSILCRISRVALILLPLHLGNDHWVLATVSKKRYAATSLKLFDSLPSDQRMTQARNLILAFVERYLWDTPPQARVVMPCASPRQTNNSDCGVFTFAFALLKATNRDLPARLNSRLWRRIMAGCLHQGSSSDMKSLIPKPTSSVSIPHALAATEMNLPQRMKALSAEYKRIRAELANDLERYSTVLCDVSLAIQVLDDIVDSTASNIKELEGKLKVAKVLEQASGFGHKATQNRSDEVYYDQPSAIRLSTLLERAREMSERTAKTSAGIVEIREEIHRAYGGLEESRGVMEDEDSIALA